MNKKPTFTLFLFEAQHIPWWKRLGAVLAIPWHVFSFIVRGKVKFCQVKDWKGWKNE